MVSTCPLISKSSSFRTNPLVTVPSEPNTIYITVTFIFNSFSILYQGLSFNLWSTGTAKSTIRQVFSFLLTLSRSGRLVEIRRSVCFSKFERLFFLDGFWVMHILFVRMVKFKFLAQFPGDTFATLLCQALTSFCANLRQLLLMWLIISSLSLHNLNLQFCCLKYSYFGVVGPFGVVLCFYQKGFVFFFWWFPFFF